MKLFLSKWLMRLRHLLGVASATAPNPMEGERSSAHGGHAAGIHELMLDCESVMRQLWDYLDGELTPERMAAIRAHIELCKRCYPQYEFERSFLDVVAARARQHSDIERLRLRLSDVLRSKGLSEV